MEMLIEFKSITFLINLILKAGAGRAIFDQQCSACHALEGDSKGATAPMLGGVVGRAAGATEFKYSNSLKKSGIVWSDKHLFM